MLYWLGADSIKEVSVGKRLKRKGTWKRYLSEERRVIFCQMHTARSELDGSVGLASRGTDILRVNASKIADRTAEIAIQRKLLSDYMRMVEQSAMAADSELYSYILKAVTEGTTFVVLKSLYGIPCERDMFYDRRRKFYWVLSGVR